MDNSTSPTSQEQTFDQAGSQVRRRVILFALVVIVFAAGAALIAMIGVPELSNVGITSGGAVFPSVSGLNLEGQEYRLPDDFQGDVVAVALPFDDAQQFAVADWLPQVEALSAEIDGFSYYNVAVFPEIEPAVRLIIRGGMVMGLDAAQRARTITVFLDDRDAFLAGLNIPDVSTLYVVLLNEERQVIWSGTGEYTADKGAALRDAVMAALAAR